MELFRRFCRFLDDEYGIEPLEAREDPHMLRFIDACVDPPGGTTVWRQRPIRTNLPQRIQRLGGILAELHPSLALTKTSLDYAHAMRRKYATIDHGSIAITPTELLALIASLDEKNPAELRLKAYLLLQWETWARPSELLRRFYPSEVDDKHKQGIVITIPRSKTNIGETAEYFTVAHDPDTTRCAVCTLRHWLDWLGPDYDGPLFPAFRSKGSKPTPLTTRNVRDQIKGLARQLGLRKPIMPYSLRKGPATTAAANGWSLEDIQKRLRHRSFCNSLSYIDRSVLMKLVRPVL